VLVPRSSIPAGQRPLKGKLVCKHKRDDAGNIIRYKVRYVVKGYAQQYSVDYDKTTTPTARLESFRAILHVATTLGWDLQQFDIKTAFLHGILPEEETMFMEQPPGFATPGKEDWVMRLMKSIYGMKQASRIWNQTFHKMVQSWGFERLPCKWCVYRRHSTTGTIIFAVHVDDIISAASSAAENKCFKDFLSSKWEISALGPASFALGIAISRDLSKHTVSLSQTALIDRVLEKFSMADANPVETPMVPGLQLRRPDKSTPLSPAEAQWFTQTPYHSLVGSLMYLAVGTRPDIAYAVGRLSTFLDCYRPEHWDATTRVLKYLKGTCSLSLVLGGHTPITLTGFSNSDYTNCPDSSRSTSGYCFSLGSGVVSWSSRKQRTIADSSCYAEYIALHDTSHEATFLIRKTSYLLNVLKV
jgi:Reverse transcriptase (RNA-dependent DNA polymerase)